MISYQYNRYSINFGCAAKSGANKTLAEIITETFPSLGFTLKMLGEDVVVVVENELSTEDLTTLTTICESFIPVTP